MTAHETIFNAINSVHRDPYLSLSAANAVVDALDAAGYTLTPGPTRLVVKPRCSHGGDPAKCATCRLRRAPDVSGIYRRDPRGDGTMERR